MIKRLYACLLYVCAFSFMAYAALFLSNGKIHQKNGGDIIDLVFGEARKVVSGFSMIRADLYFHGGVAHHHDHEDGDEDDHDHDHEHGEHHHHDADHEHGVDHDHADHHNDGCDDDDDCCDDDHHDDGCEDDDDHDDHEEEADQSLCRDWWHWANQAIHPHHPHHLQGSSRKEVLPWMWLALKSDPHNIEAWVDSAFWLSQVKGLDSALKLINKGIALNPDKPQLLFSRGDIHKQRKELVASEKDFKNALALLEKSSQAGTLDEDGLWLHRSCLQYLTGISRDQKKYGQAIYYLKRRITHPILKGKTKQILFLKNQLKELQKQQLEQLKK